MFETVDRLMLAGLGALSMTRERAERLFDDYVSRGRVEVDRREGFINDMVNSAERTRTELEQIIARQIHEALVRMDLPTREHLDRIEQKVDELLRRAAV